MLVISLNVGESIKIGESVITIKEKSGQVVRLAIDAEKSVPIRRIQPTTMANIAKAGIGLMPA